MRRALLGRRSSSSFSLGDTVQLPSTKEAEVAGFDAGRLVCRYVESGRAVDEVTIAPRLVTLVRKRGD